MGLIIKLCVQFAFKTKRYTLAVRLITLSVQFLLKP